VLPPLHKTLSRHGLARLSSWLAGKEKNKKQLTREINPNSFIRETGVLPTMSSVSSTREADDDDDPSALAAVVISAVGANSAVGRFKRCAISLRLSAQNSNVLFGRLHDLASLGNTPDPNFPTIAEFDAFLAVFRDAAAALESEYSLTVVTCLCG
jgi:hypothetical protein